MIAKNLNFSFSMIMSPGTMDDKVYNDFLAINDLGGKLEDNFNGKLF